MISDEYEDEDNGSQSELDDDRSEAETDNGSEGDELLAQKQKHMRDPRSEKVSGLKL